MRLLHRFSDAVDRRPLVVTAILAVAIKIVSLLVDHTPLFFLGDSHAYLASAIDHWVPLDRSFVYPLVIRVVAAWTHRLSLLLVLQSLAGAATAWMLAALLLRPFGVRPRVAVAAALLLAIEPGQFLYERMVLTEALSMTALAGYVLVGARYVDRPRLGALAWTCVLGIVLVSLRTVYVPVVFASAVVLPVLAAPRLETWRTRAMHLAVALAVTAACHAGYRAWIGYESDLPPAYQYHDGFFVACAWSPVLEPEDADDPRAAGAIERMVERRATMPWGEFSRDLQRWQPGWLVDDLVNSYGGDEREANAAAKRAASHAFRRDPIGVLRLAPMLYRDYWVVGTTRLATALVSEHGDDRELGPLVPILAEHYGIPNAEPIPSTLTPSKRYHTAARWLLLVFLVAPVFSALAIAAGSRDGRLPATFVFVVFAGLMATTLVFGASPVYRYLHPFAFAVAAAGATVVERWLRARSTSSAA